MKLYRSMSEKEFSDYCKGVEIVARCKMGDKNNSFDGKGICFFANPSNCALWSRDGVIVAFEIEVAQEGYGVYPDFSSNDWNDTVVIKEYCVPSYSLENAVLLGYGFLEGSKIKFYGGEQDHHAYCDYA